LGSPRLLEAYIPVSTCSPALSSIMNILTYTAKRLLSSSSGPLSPARAVHPGTRSLQSSSRGPPRPARAVLPGTGMLMSSSGSPPRPARALAHRTSPGGVGSPKRCRLRLKFKIPYPGISRTFIYSLFSSNLVRLSL
jgi:hypothetical protein